MAVSSECEKVKERSRCSKRAGAIVRGLLVRVKDRSEILGRRRVGTGCVVFAIWLCISRCVCVSVNFCGGV